MKTRQKGSQASVEFIIILSVLLMVFLYFLTAFDKRSEEFNAQPDRLYAKTITEMTAFSINEAFLAGENATIHTDIPFSLKREEKYNLSVNSHSRLVEINLKNYRYTFPIITSDIDNYTLKPGQMTIHNEGGKIVISQ